MEPNDDIFKDFDAMVKYLGYKRKTVWKPLGYGSQNTYDTARSRMRKLGRLNPKLQFAVDVFKTMKQKRRLK